MMVEHYNFGHTMEVPEDSEPNLRTGVGHGHLRRFDRERPKKDAKAKKRKRSKMSKESRKRNRSHA